MAVSREKIPPWRDHLHVTLMMGVGPIKLSAFWEGSLKTAVLVQVCSAGSSVQLVQVLHT